MFYIPARYEGEKEREKKGGERKGREREGKSSIFPIPGTAGRNENFICILIDVISAAF